MLAVTVTIPVQWSDMDALGHVNNARYFSWFESARIALFRRVGMMTTGPTGIGPILATTTCDFLSPVAFPATLEVSARVTRVGETSLTMEYEVKDAGSADRLHARGSSVAVMFDYRSMQKVRVPDDLRAALASPTC